MISPKFIAAVYGQPWNMSPLDWSTRLHQPIISGLQSGKYKELSAREPIGEAQPLSKRPSTDYLGNPIEQMAITGGVATIPIKGVLMSGASPWEKRVFDICDYGDIHEDLDAALKAKVSSIDLDVNSPGGSVMGCAETAARISEIRMSGTPVNARSSGLICSAAYYLCAGATSIRCTPTAWIGSIGTIWETVSYAELLDKIGIEVSVFTSGPLKGTGHPAKELTDAQRAYMQSMVDSMAGEFKAHVRAFRSQVKDETMQGQAMTGRQAAAAGLIDGLLAR